jgi:quercetin dioxygenase-like cupin family protein
MRPPDTAANQLATVEPIARPIVTTMSRTYHLTVATPPDSLSASTRGWQMAGVDARSFDVSDEELVAEKGRAYRIDVGGRSVWKCTFEPGCRYTEHFEPELCTAPHAAYVASGRLHIVMKDGTEAEAGPGSVVVIEPGHDAWTVGDEPCVFIDFGESLATAE